MSWDSIEQLPPIPDEHRRELQQRIEEADVNPDGGISWEDVKARLVTEDHPDVPGQR